MKNRKQIMENQQTLFRCLGYGDDKILQTPNGEYIAYQCKNASWLPYGTIEHTIESRIQFELFGEYPLTNNNQADYDSRIRKAFKLPSKND